MSRLFKLLPLKTWLILAAVVVLALVLLSWCSRGERLETAKDEATIGGARTETAIEAIDKIAENDEVHADLQVQAEEAQDAIRQAPPSDRNRVARCKLRELQGLAPC